MIINNVKLVLENEVVHGSLEMQDGKIRAFAESQSHLSEAMAPNGSLFMIINNVKLVLENEVVHGSLEMQDGKIRAFAESQSHLSEAMDGEGGWLLPGLIAATGAD